MIKKIIAKITKKNIANNVPSTYLGIDKAIETATNTTRTAINFYRNSEDRSGEDKYVDQIHEIRQLTNFTNEEEIFIPPQFRIATMNENIVKYLNRSSQLLRGKIFEEPPAPNNRKDFYKISMYLSETGFYRKLDTMLFASNMIMLTNNLDTNLFKQVASSIYGKYDIDTDKTTITVNKLREQLITDYKQIYESLFENGLEEFKGILMPLRNTAGHSDIGQKILLTLTDNPKITYNGEKQDVYPIIQKIALAYLDKTCKVYNTLGEEIRLRPKPHIEEFMRTQVQKYSTITTQ